MSGLCTSPLFTWVFAILHGQERRHLAKLFGVLLAVVDVALAVRNDVGLSSDPMAAWYVVAVLGAAVSAALFSVQAKELLHADEPLTVIALALAMGSVPMAAAVSPSFIAKLRSLSAGTWLGVIFLAFACTWLGFYFWFYALKRAPATSVAVAGSLIPMVAMLAE